MRLHKIIKNAAVLVCAAVLLSICTLPSFAKEDKAEFTVLFTHDLHSHLLPALDEDGESYGGYARLKTVIDEQKRLHPDALLLDGGDFSMGSLFQTSYRTSAVELRAMGALGYDVTTFGNHEYDEGPQGLADMLNAAADSGDMLPAIVETNYLPLGEGEGLDAARDAFARCGVENYILMERGGIWFAIFSSFGINSDEYSPLSEMTLLDRVSSAKETVAAATEQCRKENGVEPVVICLSHSGTEDGRGEDYDLAREVDGIDIIISGHTHTLLNEPLVVNDTYIVSAGEYCKNLGVITLSFDGTGVSLCDYSLLPVDASVEEDETLREQIEEYKRAVEADYLSVFGVGFDEVLTFNPYSFESVDEVYATQHESPLCNLFADAYKCAAEKATGEHVDIALTAAGVIRESLPVGNVTVADVFNAASLGTGKSDLPGGTLLSLWVTGKDLKNLLEVDASVQPLMSEAQLFCSGVEYTINTSRMFFNRVESAYLRLDDGTLEEIDEDRLYHLVTGSYAGSMLGSVGEKSFGLLSLVPRNADGEPLDADKLIEEAIVDANGTELKEWFAIAEYLRDMGGTMDEKYAACDGRKTVYSSLNPVRLLKNANKFTYLLWTLLAVVIATAAFAVRAVVRRRRKKKSMA